MDECETFRQMCLASGVPVQSARIVPANGQPKRVESYRYGNKVVLISGHFATVATVPARMTHKVNQWSARLTAPIKVSPGVDSSKCQRCGGGIY